MKASVFIATSIDGFIARSDGALDWLPEGGGEPHGYLEFMSTVDALVIGRKTFETVLSFSEWPYGAKPVVVLSSNPFEPRAAIRHAVHDHGRVAGRSRRSIGC
jgi:dihydrofolate reductase